MTVAPLYKAELLRSGCEQELKNKSNSEEGYQDGNQEAEDRRQGTRNKNLDSVYCHGGRRRLSRRKSRSGRQKARNKKQELGFSLLSWWTKKVIETEIKKRKTEGKEQETRT